MKAVATDHQAAFLPIDLKSHVQLPLQEPENLVHQREYANPCCDRGLATQPTSGETRELSGDHHDHHANEIGGTAVRDLQGKKMKRLGAHVHEEQDAKRKDPIRDGVLVPRPT